MCKHKKEIGKEMREQIKSYKTREWIIIASLAAVMGVFLYFMDTMWSVFSNLLGPTFMALTFGIYALSALLPGYLLRKPGAALLGSVFAAVINILVGSPFGIHIIVAGSLQGLGAEVAFGITRYKKYGIGNFMLAGIFITLFVSSRDYFVFSLGMLPPALLIATLAIRIVSISIISYFICVAIGAALKKTNLIKNL